MKILFAIAVVVCAACSKPNPGACCATEAQCASLGIDGIRDCANGNVCSPAGVCTAAECATNIDCPATTPLCENQLCVAGCTTSMDCESYPGRPICAVDGTCTACTDSAQCPNDRPMCNTGTGECEAATTGDSGTDGADACVPELLFQRGVIFGGPEIFRVNLHDFVEHSVSNGMTDMQAAWSPDGSKIVLVRGYSAVTIVDADGSNPHEVGVAPGEGFLTYPQFSPDGTQIAYAYLPSGASGQQGRIYVGSASNGSPVDVSPSDDAQGPLEWSPDGTTIAFVSNRTGNLDVFTMLPDGTGVRNLTNRSGSDGVEGPHWSPDGSKLVFGANHVWVVNSDGTGLTNFTGTSNTEDQPAWASTGDIYYVKSPTAGAQLFVMNANGTNQHAIENEAAIDERPIPSPDGSMIAWVSYRDGNGEIYVAAADGSNPTRVTNNTAKDNSPRWRPCPR